MADVYAILNYFSNCLNLDNHIANNLLTCPSLEEKSKLLTQYQKEIEKCNSVRSYMCNRNRLWIGVLRS